jgi:hypothetical protein
MLLLFALIQAVDPDEVVTAPRLFAKAECPRPSSDEIVVCRTRDADRIGHAAPQPDPMTVDRRPRIKVGKDLCLRVGFSFSLSNC